MNRDKQIEEMAKAVCHLERTCDQCMTSFECKAMVYAKRFYEAGYRKASKIFEEIEKIVLAGIEKDEIFREKMHTDTDRSYFEGGANSQRKLLWFIRELKNKYTEDNGNDI